MNWDTRSGRDRPIRSEYYDLFTASRRRTTLAVLTRTTDAHELEDLAATVAEREADADDVDDATVERVALVLHHVHLPKLAELGVLEYDRQAALIEWYQ